MIIDNNLRSIYVTPDNLLSEQTKLKTDVSSGATNISVINGNGISAGQYLYIGDVGADRSELTKVNSLTANTIYIEALKQSHEIKDKVYVTDYNQINLYKDYTMVNTIAIKADYYSRFDVTIDKDSSYYITFDDGTTESEKREEINGYERCLCSIGDVYSYEKPDGLSLKLLSKIDLASREIRNLFINQEQEFTDLSNNEVELLRQPTAILALYYAWFELIKQTDDMPSLKTEHYKKLYDKKINEVLEVISKKNSNISMFGQSRMLR